MLSFIKLLLALNSSSLGSASGAQSAKQADSYRLLTR